MLEALGEGDFTFVPEEGLYMNDDAFNRHLRILTPIEKIFNKPITLTREEGLIREVFPEYYVYARQRGLPINDETTFEEFLDRMSTSTRGVTLKDPGLAEEYLTTAGNTPNSKPGGDRLHTNSGLYTSNSEELSDRFSKNISGVTNNPYGAKAKLYHQFDIDFTLPIYKRLQQLRNQINDVTVSIPEDLKSIWVFDYKNRFNLSTPDYNSNAEIHAVEGPYMGGSSKERVYIGHNDKDKVVDIKDNIDITTNTVDRHHRWSAGKVADEEGLFLPSYASLTPENIEKYTQRIIESNPKWDAEFKNNLQKRLVRVMNIYRRKNRAKIMPVIGALLGATGVFTKSLYSNSKKSIEESNERFYNYLEAAHNSKYSKESLKILRYNLGMEDASDEEVIQMAEEVYKELTAERRGK